MLTSGILIFTSIFVFYIYHHNRFTALFPGPPGWAGARTELLDFMVQGKIKRGRHTDHPAGRHSIRTSQCPPPPSPIFFIYRVKWNKTSSQKGARYISQRRVAILLTSFTVECKGKNTLKAGQDLAKLWREYSRKLWTHIDPQTQVLLHSVSKVTKATYFTLIVWVISVFVF